MTMAEAEVGTEEEKEAGTEEAGTVEVDWEGEGVEGMLLRDSTRRCLHRWRRHLGCSA